MTKYYICLEPGVGKPQNEQPVAVGHHEDHDRAQAYCDNHNLTAGPGLRMYVVPEGLLWTTDEVEASA